MYGVTGCDSTRGMYLLSSDRSISFLHIIFLFVGQGRHRHLVAAFTSVASLRGFLPGKAQDTVRNEKDRCVRTTHSVLSTVFGDCLQAVAGNSKDRLDCKKPFATS